MMQRTTIAAPADDLETLRAEAKQRGISLARLMAELIAEKAAELREGRRPRVGIGRSGSGVARESVADEDSPVATAPRD